MSETFEIKKTRLKNMREYAIWCGMKSRCNNPNRKSYAYYGARGISVCQRWSDSFDCFLADMGPCPPGYSIERKNNNGNYEPSNCKWASDVEQARNKRGNVRITVNGVTKLASEWAREAGINQATFSERIEKGLTGEELVAPKKSITRDVSHNGKTQSATAWAKELGINYNTLIHRIDRMSVSDAFAGVDHRRVAR